MSNQEITVKNLKCEYLKNPQGIDITNPRLSWELTSNRRNKKTKKLTRYRWPVVNKN